MLLDKYLEKYAAPVAFEPVTTSAIKQPQTPAAATYKKAVRTAQTNAAKGMQKNTMAPVSPTQNKVR